MSAIKRHYEERIQRAAWELADITPDGPEDATVERFVDKLWELSCDDSELLDAILSMAEPFNNGSGLELSMWRGGENEARLQVSSPLGGFAIDAYKLPMHIHNIPCGAIVGFEEREQALKAVKDWAYRNGTDRQQKIAFYEDVERLVV